MTSVKVKFRPSCIEGKAGTVYYQVTHRRTVKHIAAGIHIPHGWWSGEQGHIVAAGSEAVLLQNRVDSDVAVLNGIIRELEAAGGCDFSAEDIVVRFRSPSPYVSVVGFMQEQIRFLTDCNRLGTAKNYRSALCGLTDFLGGRDLSFREFTPRLVEQYNDHLQRRGLVRNSQSFHMRILRAVYNKAVRCGLAEQVHPFRSVYTGIDRTRKRAVDKRVISQLMSLDLSRSAPLALVRDLFLFSLYTRGMSFVDMAFLRAENICDGAICYTRRKTGQQLCIHIEPCIQQILDRYAGRGGAYLFPLLKSDDAAASYAQYRTSIAYCNRLLKRLSQMLGLQHGLSFHAARHSWATMARDSNVPVSVISAGMGHTSERTTRIYLSSIDNSLIDNANRGILDGLCETCAM